MDAWSELLDDRITTRAAAALTGLRRATALRHGTPRRAPADPVPRVASVNELTAAECAYVVEVLNSARFVDAAPMQVWATLLDENIHLCSISRMYRF